MSITSSAYNVQKARAVEIASYGPCRPCSVDEIYRIQKASPSQIFNVKKARLVKETSHCPYRVWQGQEESCSFKESPGQVEETGEAPEETSTV